LVAYPAKLSLHYRVGNAWLEERTLAGEIVKADHEIDIDLDQLDDMQREDAVALARTLDKESVAWVTTRTPVIVGSGIDPGATVDNDFMDQSILAAIGTVPQLAKPTRDQARVIEAWTAWVRQYKELAPAAFQSFVSRWADDAAKPDDKGQLPNGANTAWWTEQIGARPPGGRPKRFTIDGAKSPELFLRARAARQRINHAKTAVDKSDLALAVGIVGSYPNVEDEQAESVVAAFESYAERASNLAFARFWTGQRQKAGFEQEMVRWAAREGSERLKLGLQDGYRMTPVYLQERITAEVPGFYAHLPGKDDARLWQPRTGPSEAALKLRRAVQDRMRTANPYAGTPPEVQIGWIKDPPAAMCDLETRSYQHGPYDEDCGLLEDPFEVIVVPDWLGRYVLLAAVWTDQEPQPPDYVLMKHVLDPAEYELGGELPLRPPGLTAKDARRTARQPADDDIPF
jgi:hypothetical protein